MNRIDSPDLDVDASSVLVLKNGGPIGAPGMPEYGNMQIPAKLLKRGVQDMVRISDARMSGTSYGTVVLHVSPRVGGRRAAGLRGEWRRSPLGYGRAEARPAPSATRRWRGAEPRGQPREAHYDRGYGKMFLNSVLQADEGCDFSFLRGTGKAEKKLPLAF